MTAKRSDVALPRAKLYAAISRLSDHHATLELDLVEAERSRGLLARLFRRR